MTPILAAKGISVRFGGLVALEGVSLELGEGERLALVGPNGAGKSTLLDVLGGQLLPSAGKVELMGCDVTGRTAHARARSGLMRTFQHHGLLERLSVIDNVELSDRRRGPRRARAKEALRQVGFPHDPGAPVHDLAAADRARVALARALVAQPKVLLLDEPGAGLSAPDKVRLVESLRDLRAALLVVEHDLGLVQQLAPQALLLDAGRAVELVATAQMTDHAKVRAAYLGPGGRA